MPLIRIFSRSKARGLSRDLRLVASLLAEAGHEVQAIGFSSEKGVRAAHIGGLWLARAWRGRADLQLFLEHLYPATFALARRNVLVPNPEWFRPRWHAQLPRIDGVLCKTRHAQRLFDELGRSTRYIGFTSEDRLDASVPRERMFLHLAGRSPVKGTEVVLEAWRRHPEWPTLVVVQTPRYARPAAPVPNIDHRIGNLDERDVRLLQNRCRFHVCPSEAEGFGHCLVEALSVGAVVITTDGEPMNEVVTPAAGVLVPAVREERLHLARRFFVDVAGVERAVQHVLGMDAAAVQAMSRRSREAFETRDRDFRSSFAATVAPLAGAG